MAEETREDALISFFIKNHLIISGENVRLIKQLLKQGLLKSLPDNIEEFVPFTEFI